jgi:hypothetical protein
MDRKGEKYLGENLAVAAAHNNAYIMLADLDD